MLLKTSSGLSLLTPSSGTISTIPSFSAPSSSCSLLSGQPTAKRWGFFSEDPSVKLGFSPLSSLRWDRQVAPRTSAEVCEPRCQHSPRLSSLFPSHSEMESQCHPHGWILVSTPQHTKGNGGAASHVATESGLCSVVDGKHHNALCRVLSCFQCLP